MNRYTFVLPSENQKDFRLLSICNTVTQGHLVDQFFCKDIHESLKCVDELSELTNDEIRKVHASLSLLVDL